MTENRNDSIRHDRLLPVFRVLLFGVGEQSETGSISGVMKIGKFLFLSFLHESIK